MISSGVCVSKIGILLIQITWSRCCSNSIDNLNLDVVYELCNVIFVLKDVSIKHCHFWKPIRIDTSVINDKLLLWKVMKSLVIYQKNSIIYMKLGFSQMSTIIILFVFHYYTCDYYDAETASAVESYRHLISSSI